MGTASTTNQWWFDPNDHSVPMRCWFVGRMPPWLPWFFFWATKFVQYQNCSGFKETKQEFSWENRPEAAQIGAYLRLIMITLWSQIQHFQGSNIGWRAWEKPGNCPVCEISVLSWISWNDLVGQVIWFIKNRCKESGGRCWLKVPTEELWECQSPSVFQRKFRGRNFRVTDF